jgi:hypothetical protein
METPAPELSASPRSAPVRERQTEAYNRGMGGIRRAVAPALDAACAILELCECLVD